MASVVEQTPYNRHVGNGVATVFGYEFQLLAATDLVVTIDGAVVPASSYTVSGVGDQGGGDVTFTTAPANLADVLLERVIKLERDTDYQYAGDFRESTVDRDFNRIWQALQGQATDIGRAIRAPEAEGFADLPDAATRALKILGFAADGSLALSTPAEGSATALALLLASSSLTTQGAGAIGIDESLAYPLGTVGWALIRRSYNARARGALGDGVNNDAPVINAGLAAGRWVELDNPPAYYKVDSALAMPQRGGLIGESRHATIIRRSGGSGSVITCDGVSGDGGPYLIRNVRLGGAGCKGITEKAGGYTNYVARLQLEGVATEADLAVGIEANLIYFIATNWWDGYFQESGIHASHTALLSSSSGPLNTNVNTLRHSYTGQSPAAYCMQISGGVQWRFEQHDWSLNKRNLYAVNISSLHVLQAYTEGGNPVTGSLFVIDPTTRATAVFDGGTYDAGAMAAGCNIFGFAPAVKALVKHVDMITSASAFAYMDTTTLAHYPTANHRFEDFSLTGNTSDPLYPFSGVAPDAPQAWTPVPNGLTLGGAPGTATYAGWWSIRNRMVTVGIRIVTGGGTTTTASTAATTFFALPTGIPVPAYSAAGSVANEVLGDIGACFAYSNGRVYMPAWAAQLNNILITVTYPI